MTSEEISLRLQEISDEHYDPMSFGEAKALVAELEDLNLLHSRNADSLYYEGKANGLRLARIILESVV